MERTFALVHMCHHSRPFKPTMKKGYDCILL
uniref:Uncharacterized protein n=1 Tax=Arundo donax TaxID=35708 RepID=A0A0A8Z3Y4_ARUDO